MFFLYFSSGVGVLRSGKAAKKLISWLVSSLSLSFLNARYATFSDADVPSPGVEVYSCSKTFFLYSSWETEFLFKTFSKEPR